MFSLWRFRTGVVIVLYTIINCIIIKGSKEWAVMLKKAYPSPHGKQFNLSFLTYMQVGLSSSKFQSCGKQFHRQSESASRSEKGLMTQGSLGESGSRPLTGCVCTSGVRVLNQSWGGGISDSSTVARMGRTNCLLRPGQRIIVNPGDSLGKQKPEIKVLIQF